MSDLPVVPNESPSTSPTPTAGMPAGPATPAADTTSPQTPGAMGGTPAGASTASPQSATPSSPAAAPMGGASAGAPTTPPSAASSGAPLQPQYTPQQQRAMAMGGFMDATTSAMAPGHKAPGSIWRTILSAALVGAAAGAGHGWEGAGKGMEAEQKLIENQKKQQQQQFENERQKRKDALEETKEAREGKVADSAVLHNNAATALANIETVQKAKALFGQDQAAHNQNAAEAKPEWDMFLAAGGKPWVETNSKGETITYDNIRESDALHKQHPDGFGTKRWIVTGTAPIRDKDGKAIDTENTYTAYDTAAELPLTASKIKQWEDDGLLEAFPSLLTSNLVKTDTATGKRTISWLDYRNLEKQAAPLRAARLQRQDEDNKKRHEQDVHDLSVAQQNEAAAVERSHKDAAAAAEYEQATKEKTEAAEKKYQEKGWDSLKGDEKFYARRVIQDDINHQTTLLNSGELQKEENSTDPAVSAAAYKKAAEYRAKIDDLSRKILPASAPSPASSTVQKAIDSSQQVTQAVTSLKEKSPGEARKTVDALTGFSPDQKTAILQQLSLGRKDDVEYNRELLLGLGREVIRRITGRYPI